MRKNRSRYSVSSEYENNLEASIKAAVEAVKSKNSVDLERMLINGLNPNSVYGSTEEALGAEKYTLLHYAAIHSSPDSAEVASRRSMRLSVFRH